MRDEPLKVGSLFAGIGGFDLGFERAGMHTSWFVERDAYCQAVLRKHWPEVPIYDDVCTVSVEILTPVDVLCGGFPCQDISTAGRGAGLDGARSGLWSEFHRLIGELRPRYVVVENVPVLRSRGLGRILGEMASLGYDAEWDCVPAQAIGAPHRRDRVWIVAYQPGLRGRVANAHCKRGTAGRRYYDLAGAPRAPEADCEQRKRCRDAADDRGADPVAAPHGRDGSRGWTTAWPAEPDVGRVADGIPARMDRLRSLGNALVPQIAEEIGRRIIEWEGT